MSYNVYISIETAQIRLHNLGFDQKSHHKSIYFDGHERDDVTEYRMEFIDRMLVPGEKPIIQIHHNEYIFYANADQSSVGVMMP